MRISGVSLKRLLSDPTVTDEVLLRQVTKTTNEESERKHRMVHCTRPKVAHALSYKVTIDMNKEKNNRKTNAKDELVHWLSAQVQVLTQAVSSFQSNVSRAVKPRTSEHQCLHYHPNQHNRPQRKERRLGCPNCIASHLTRGAPCCGVFKKTQPVGKRHAVTATGSTVTNRSDPPQI